MIIYNNVCTCGKSFLCKHMGFLGAVHKHKQVTLTFHSVIQSIHMWMAGNNIINPFSLFLLTLSLFLLCTWTRKMKKKSIIPFRILYKQHSKFQGSPLFAPTQKSKKKRENLSIKYFSCCLIIERSFYNVLGCVETAVLFETLRFLTPDMEKKDKKLLNRVGKIDFITFFSLHSNAMFIW